MRLFKQHIRLLFQEHSGHRWFTIINGAGLALGLALGISVLMYVKFEVTYDSHFSHNNRMYRIVSDGVVGDDPINAAAVPMPLRTVVDSLGDMVEHSTHFCAGHDDLVRYRQKAYAENRTVFADTGFFSVFDVEFISGSSTDALKDTGSVVITQSTALRYFEHENPMGKILEFDKGTKLTVTGVCEDAPSNSHFHYDMILPMKFLERIILQKNGAETLKSWEDNWFNINSYQYVVLRDGVDREQFIEQVNALKKPLLVKQMESEPSLKEMLKTHSRLDFKIQSVREIHLKSHLEGELEPNTTSLHVSLAFLFGIVIFLITALNFVNLTTSHVQSKMHEVRVKMLMGASRLRLFLMFLGESFVNTFLALFLAMVLVEISFPLFSGWLNLGMHLSQVRGVSDLVMELIVMVIVALLTGLVPAFYFSMKEVCCDTSKEIYKKGTGYYLKGILVLIQVAASVIFLVLVIGIWHQLNGIKTTDLGFNANNVFVIKRAEAIGDKYQLFKEKLLQDSSILQVSTSSTLPGEVSSIMAFRIADSINKPFYLWNVNVVGDDYFRLMQIPLREGTYPNVADSNGIVVNEALMRETALLRYNQYPIEWVGAGDDGNGRNMRIVGVINDCYSSNLKSSVTPMLYMPHAHWYKYILVRYKGNQEAQARASAIALWNDYTNFHPFNTISLKQQVDGSYQRDEKLFRIAMIMALFSLFMTGLSVVGLSVFYVNIRQEELEIRRMNGAAQYQLIVEVIQQLSTFVFVGVLLALPLSYIFLKSWLAQFVVTYPLAWWVYFPIGGGVATIGLIIIYQQVRYLFGRIAR